MKGKFKFWILYLIIAVCLFYGATFFVWEDVVRGGNFIPLIIAISILMLIPLGYYWYEKRFGRGENEGDNQESIFLTKIPLGSGHEVLRAILIGYVILTYLIYFVMNSKNDIVQEISYGLANAVFYGLGSVFFFVLSPLSSLLAILSLIYFLIIIIKFFKDKSKLDILDKIFFSIAVISALLLLVGIYSQ